MSVTTKTRKLGEICTIKEGRNPDRHDKTLNKGALCEKPGIIIPRENHALNAQLVMPPFMGHGRTLYLMTDFAEGVDLGAVVEQLNAKAATITKGSAKPTITVQALSELEIELPGGDDQC